MEIHVKLEEQKMSQLTDSRIGSDHWRDELLNRLINVGKFINEHGRAEASEDKLKSWGKGIEECAQELIDYYKQISPIYDYTKGIDYTKDSVYDI